METSETSNDPAISGLMSMVDYFLSQHPQQVQEGIHCLLAALSLHPPPRIEARARLQLGLVLYHHTNNLLEAREHLDKAMLMAQSAANLEDVRFEAASIAARILLEQNCVHQAKSLLKGKLEGSAHFPYWHTRLMLQLADVYACERDESSVVSTLDRCVEYTRQTEAPHTRLLCLLYKGAYQLTHKCYHEAGEVLNLCSTLLEEYQGEKVTLLRTFYLIIQVTHLLSAGQVKTAKPHLKQLQHCVKVLSNEPESSSIPPTSTSLTAESFEWLTREQTYVIVYLVSVMHSVQAGYTEKALSYADKAMQFIEQQKDTGVVLVLKAHLLERIIICLLVQGKSSQAVDKLHETVDICHNHAQLVYSHRAVLHTLLGLYAFATDSLDRAASQFHTALQHTNSSDLRVFVSLNLAVTYMKIGEEKNTELSALMQSLETPNTSCQSLLAAVHYVKGLHSFCQLKLHEAKRHLRETLVTSNSGDLNKLTACSLILLGQIFLSLGNTKETMDMVSPAMQLASKIPDKKLQVWAATLLADLYHVSGDQSSESSTRDKCSKALNELHSDQADAAQSSHHSLVQWTVGEWPVTKPIPKPNHEGLILSSSSAGGVVMKSEVPLAATLSPSKNEIPLLDGLKLKQGSKHLAMASGSPERVRTWEVPRSARTLNYDGAHAQRGEEIEHMEVDRVKVKTSNDTHKRPPEHSLQSPLQKQQRFPSSYYQSPVRKQDHHETRIRKNVPASLALSNNSPSSSPALRENLNSASPTHRGSPTLRGSPVALKTPEIRLTKMNSSPLANPIPRQLQFPPPATQKHTQPQSLAPSSYTPVLQQNTTPPRPQHVVPTHMHSPPLQAGGSSPYQNTTSRESLSSPQSTTTSPTPPCQTIVHSPNVKHSSVLPVNQMLAPLDQRGSTSPHQQARLSPRPTIVRAHSPQMLYHPQSLLLEQQQTQALTQQHQAAQAQQQTLTQQHQAQALTQQQQAQALTQQQQAQALTQQQQVQALKPQQALTQQQQLLAQQQALAQQQNVLQHYSPQKLQHMHNLSEQQHRQAMFQHQQQAYQQQMMLQQAQAQQQYLLQQATMQNHQQMLSHAPNMHLQSGMHQYYAVNPSAMPPTLHHSLGSSPSKQVHHLSHMNTLQRLSQEPNRSSLGMMSLPQRCIMPSMMAMNPYAGSPHQGQLLPNGSNIQRVSPNPSASPLRHYSPQSHMPGR